jgi:hypothetical protein
MFHVYMTCGNKSWRRKIGICEPPLRCRWESSQGGDAYSNTVGFKWMGDEISVLLLGEEDDIQFMITMLT